MDSYQNILILLDSVERKLKLLNLNLESTRSDISYFKNDIQNSMISNQKKVSEINITIDRIEKSYSTIPNYNSKNFNNLENSNIKIFDKSSNKVTFEKIEKPFEKFDKSFEKFEKPLEKIEKPLEKIEKPLEKIEKPFEKIEKPLEKVDKSFEKVEKPLEKVDKIIESKSNNSKSNKSSKNFNLIDLSVDLFKKS